MCNSLLYSLRRKYVNTTIQSTSRTNELKTLLQNEKDIIRRIITADRYRYAKCRIPGFVVFQDLRGTSKVGNYKERVK